MAGTEGKVLPSTFGHIVTVSLGARQEEHFPSQEKGGKTHPSKSSCSKVLELMPQLHQLLVHSFSTPVGEDAAALELSDLH